MPAVLSRRPATPRPAPEASNLLSTSLPPCSVCRTVTCDRSEPSPTAHRYKAASRVAELTKFGPLQSENRASCDSDRHEKNAHEQLRRVERGRSRLRQQHRRACNDDKGESKALNQRRPTMGDGIIRLARSHKE